MEHELSRTILEAAKELTVSCERKTVTLTLKYPKAVQARLFTDLLRRFQK